MESKVGARTGVQTGAAPSRRQPGLPQALHAAVMMAAATAAFNAVATEGGGNSYPVGVETNYNGLMLPEGLHPFYYYSYYSASHFKDNRGNNSAQLAKFHIESNIVAARLSYIWPGVKLFGANLETRVVQAVAKIDMDAAVARPAPLAPLDHSGSRTGLADTSFSPLILGWHSPGFHQTLGLDTHLKVGAYDSAERVNTGRNYYQLAPFYAFTWFPTRDIDVNAKIRYAYNTRNTATDYKSGNEATLEFSAGYHATPAFAFGVNGYIYRQTSDDTQHGASVNGNGNRGSVNAIGPYFSYSITPKVTLVVKMQSEFNARNRPEGTRIWAQARIPF
jgi:hypothetical protein